jgi:hypothetical protein
VVVPFKLTDLMSLETGQPSGAEGRDSPLYDIVVVLFKLTLLDVF